MSQSQHWTGMVESSSIATRSSVSTLGGLVVAMFLTSLVSSIISFSTGFLGMGGGSILGGVLLPLLGLSSIRFRSRSMILAFSMLTGTVALVALVSFITLLSLTAGDPIGCFCDFTCGKDFGSPLNGGSILCRHQTHARVVFWLSISFSIIMEALQIASIITALRIYSDDEFEEKGAFTEPLASPTAESPVLRRTAGYTYVIDEIKLPKSTPQTPLKLSPFQKPGEF